MILARRTAGTRRRGADNTPHPGTGSGTGTGNPPLLAVAGAAAAAAGVGAAAAATVSTASQGSAAAGTGGGTGVVADGAAKLGVSAAAATGTGAANAAVATSAAQTSAAAGSASGTGAARTPAAAIITRPAAATGTGVANASTASTGNTPPTANMEVWYQADAITGLSDGDLLTAWPDSSGNGYVTDQPFSSHAPAYKTGIVNGKPVVRFSSTRGDAVRSSAPTSAAAQTLFAVLRPTGTSGMQSIRNPDVGALLLRLSSGKADLVRAGVAIIGTGTTTLSTANFTIICATFTAGSSWAIYLNGTADGSGTTSVTLTSAGVTNGVGSDGIFGGNSFDGDIAELITYSTVLGSTDRGTVTSYLSAKYAI